MADPQFTQLHDRDFLARTRHMPAEALAAKLGCHPTTVESCRQRYGILQRPSWSAAEIELLSDFYGRFPASYLACAMGRSTRSLYSYASRHGLHTPGGLRGSPEVEARFWTEWQAALRSRWPSWQRRGLGEVTLGLLWRPAHRVMECARCAHLATCRRLGKLPLRCERLTLGDVLGLHLPEEDRRLF